MGMYMNKTHNFCELGLAVINTEIAAINRLKQQIDGNFSNACQHILDCQGRVVVTGMGKSGHIAKKVAATLASTGTPSFYVHPGEASHGDLGMITQRDVVLAFSFSGETKEIITILPLIKRFHIPMISITGNPKSTLATESSVHLDASIEKEACPLNLAPTASTTAALVMGDALAIALLEARGFTKEDFARSHPGGSLGKRLLLHADDIMHKNNDIPMVSPDTLINQALVEMTSKRLGMTAIVDKQKCLLGVYTDGDLRRTLDHDIDFKTTPIKEVMTKKPVTAKTGLLAAELLQLMETKKVNGIFVVNEKNQIQGALNMQDLLRAGVL